MVYALRKDYGAVKVERDLPNVIVGLGKTGLSCARYVAARGETFVAVDSREQPPGLEEFRAAFPAAPVHLGGFDAELLARARRLIVSPGVALAEPAVAAAIDDGAEALGDIELFARSAQAPVLAITGANGKSTATTMVGEMIRRAGHRVKVGGNLGTPALDLLDGEEPDFYVLELSSFQLETTRSLNPAAAVVLNISADHMDRYRDLADYTAAKRRIYRGDGVMVINDDDPLVAAMAEPDRECRRFGLREPAAADYGVREREGQLWLVCGNDDLMPASELRIKGLHNVANALAALALCEAVGAPREALLEALRHFPGLPHRTQWVARYKGVDWYDDSKGTNVGATLAALQGMPGTVVLIAGGLGKGQDFTPLRAAVAAKVRAVVLLGKDAPVIERALANAVPLLRVNTMEEAVAQAADVALPGDAVLLSPACASFDMFKGYDHRGDVFTAAVRGLP